MPEPPAPIKPPLSHYPAGDRQRGGPRPPGTQRPTVPAVVRGPPAWQLGISPPPESPQPPHHHRLRETEARIIQDARGGSHPEPLASLPGILGGWKWKSPRDRRDGEGAGSWILPMYRAPTIRGGVPSTPEPPHAPGIPQTKAWGPLCRCCPVGVRGCSFPQGARRVQGRGGSRTPGFPPAPPPGPAGAGRSPPGNGAGRGAAPAGPPLSPTPGRCRPDSTAPTGRRRGRRGLGPRETLQGCGVRGVGTWEWSLRGILGCLGDMGTSG